MSYMTSMTSYFPYSSHRFRLVDFVHHIVYSLLAAHVSVHALALVVLL